MKKVYLMAVTLLLSLFAAVSPAYGATAADSVTVTLTWKLVNQTGDVDVIKKFVIGNESGFTTLLAKDLKGTSATVKVPKGVYTMFMQYDNSKKALSGNMIKIVAREDVNLQADTAMLFDGA